MNGPLLTRSEDGERCELHSPVALPSASAYLWNRHMLLQASCRGFVSAQHLQPEPARYSYGPMLEATTFMQPEQPRYAHQPGRFVYIREADDGGLYSLPYEPVRRQLVDTYAGLWRETLEHPRRHRFAAQRLQALVDAAHTPSLSAGEDQSRNATRHVGFPGPRYARAVGIVDFTKRCLPVNRR